MCFSSLLILFVADFNMFLHLNLIFFFRVRNLNILGLNLTLVNVISSFIIYLIFFVQVPINLYDDGYGCDY